MTPLKLYLTWPDRDTALSRMQAVLGGDVAAMPLDGDWQGIHYSAAVFGVVNDPDGVPQDGFHVGLWVHISPKDFAALPDFGATVRTEAELQDWWPRLG